jgi:hypothetical protein
MDRRQAASNCATVSDELQDLLTPGHTKRRAAYEPDSLKLEQRALHKLPVIKASVLFAPEIALALECSRRLNLA